MLEQQHQVTESLTVMYLRPPEMLAQALAMEHETVSLGGQVGQGLGGVGFEMAQQQDLLAASVVLGVTLPVHLDGLMGYCLVLNLKG